MIFLTFLKFIFSKYLFIFVFDNLLFPPIILTRVCPKHPCFFASLSTELFPHLVHGRLIFSPNGSLCISRKLDSFYYFIRRLLCHSFFSLMIGSYRFIKYYFCLQKFPSSTLFQLFFAYFSQYSIMNSISFVLLLVLF